MVARTSLLLCLALLWSSPVPAQTQPGTISITRADGTESKLSPEQLLQLPRMAITATAHEKTNQFESTDLLEVLRLAGAEPPAQSRGAMLRRVLTVRAGDGYMVAFAFAEIDPSIGGKKVYVVNRQDGQVLKEGEGPWRLVIPSEGRPTRWVRNVVQIAVSDAR